VQVSLSDFKCEGLVEQSQLNRLDFQNVADKDASFCLTSMYLK
jgi:cullin-associated NEDD8-dissociated protein 1